MPKAKIGILGGSFNPPHLGHVHLAETMRKQFGFKQVWFLVSPQNPHKSVAGMVGFEERCHLCELTLSDKPYLKVCRFEQKIGNTFTQRTLEALKKAYPMYDFVWLMGADNLKKLHKWQNFAQILQKNKIIIMDRIEPQRYGLLKSPALQNVKHKRQQFERLTSTPKWLYLFTSTHQGRATNIRNAFKIGHMSSMLHPKVVQYLQQNQVPYMTNWF